VSATVQSWVGLRGESICSNRKNWMGDVVHTFRNEVQLLPLACGTGFCCSAIVRGDVRCMGSYLETKEIKSSLRDGALALLGCSRSSDFVEIQGSAVGMRQPWRRRAVMHVAEWQERPLPLLT
jgi:hypothetical protein